MVTLPHIILLTQEGKLQNEEAVQAIRSSGYVTSVSRTQEELWSQLGQRAQSRLILIVA